MNPIDVVDKCSKSVLTAESSHSDLLKGIYEGGLKIWECTYDLGDYILINLLEQIKGAKIFDLGCRSGIIGIVALENEAETVHFQDYVSVFIIFAVYIF